MGYKIMKQHQIHQPVISDLAFVAENSSITGEVQIGDYSNVWFGAVLRGDYQPIVIGKYTNIQDLTTIHIGEKTPVQIGDFVTIGHNAIIHGCSIQSFVLIGMGAIILDGAIIQEYSIVGAGSLVTQNKTFPPGMLIMGSPAKVVRPLTDQEKEDIRLSACHYVEFAKKYTTQN